MDTNEHSSKSLDTDLHGINTVFRQDIGQWGVLGTHCPQNVVFAAVACHRPPAALSEVFLEASFCENFDRVHLSSYDDPQMALRLAESSRWSLLMPEAAMRKRTVSMPEAYG